MRINHNIAALNTYRQLGNANNAQMKSMEKLSSGLRINSAADDAAGLAISEKMRGQIRGLDMASKNAQDATSLIQTAEGALNETHSILQRMRELPVQAGNDTNTDTDRAEIQKEINQLTSEINRIGNTTEFNTQKLLDGGLAGSAQTSGATLSGGAAQVTQQEAVYKFSLENFENVQAGDTIEFDFNGTKITLTAKDGDASATGEFNINATATTMYSNITSALNDALTANGGLNASWVAGNADGSGFTITAQADTAVEGVAGGTTGNEVVTISNQTLTGGAVASTILDTEGKDFRAAETASGTIDFSTNLLSSGSRITIADQTFVLYDSTEGEVAPTAADTRGIDIASISNNEDIIDAIINSHNNNAISGVVLEKTSTNQLTVKAASAGTAGNGIAISVEAPAGQKNEFTADFQIGANKGQSMSISIGDMRANALGISSLSGTSNTVEIDGKSYEVAWADTQGVTNGTDNVNSESALSVATHDDAAKAIEVLDAAIQKVSGERSKLGAYQNRLDHTINNLSTSSENLTAAESRIRDVDMAKEMMEQTKNSILAQASQAMLAQANSLPQGVLQLLR